MDAEVDGEEKMIPWGLLGAGNIETVVQFMLKAGYSSEQIIAELTSRLNPAVFQRIIESVSSELSSLVAFMLF